MSAAVRQALAARRAAARSPQKGSTTLSHDPSNTSAQSPSPSPGPSSGDEFAVAVARKPIAHVLEVSCETGRANLASRALDAIPPELFSYLLADLPPPGRKSDRPWWERQDLTVLLLSSNEIAEIDSRLDQFRGLTRLDLHNNRLTSPLPLSLSHLVNLTTLTLSHNGLVEFPSCLLALDNLVTLDLSHNKIQTLWDDDSVVGAREQREAWDKEQEELHSGGIWAGLTQDEPKKSKSNGQPKLDDSQSPRSSPMASLRTLDLSSNRLSNVALGMAPPNAQQTAKLTLPYQLRKLILSDNRLRSPLTTGAFTSTPKLAELELAGNSLIDDVFAVTATAAPTEDHSSVQVFANLQTLDLQRCELDDLTQLEAFFGSRRTVNTLGEGVQASDEEPKEASQDGAIAPRQLVRFTDKPSPSDLQEVEKATKPVLCLLVEGNPLREEIARQKRGFARTAPVKPSALDQEAHTGGSSSGETASEDQKDPSSSDHSAATPTTPVKQGIVKEEWEIQAELGLLTEGGRRRLRAEQARKEREAQATAGIEDETESTPPRSRSGQRGTPARRGVNTTGLSDWDGEPVLPRRSRNGAPSQAQQLSDDEGEGGSALASTKLSSKKKEALSQVPCKFFRANGCTAGKACPFSHTLPEPGQQKAVCQWFMKGSCRFGHKCALAHVLPGQPMSMDRKNKRAAQSQQSGGKQQQTPQQQQQQDQPRQRDQSRGQQTGSQQGFGQGGEYDFQNSASGTEPIGIASGSRVRPQSFSRDSDFPFGLPDDLQSPPSSAARPTHSQYPIEYDTVSMSPSASHASALHRQALLSDLSRQLGDDSGPRPLAVPPGGISMAAGRGRMSVDGGAPLGGSPSRGSGAFGTSPFSHPGGHSVFFSGSQDSTGDGPLHRRASAVDPFGARSMGRIDDAHARAKWWESLGTPSRSVSASGIGMGMHADEQDDDEAGDLNEEDFLPSSLSDLLTPAELERRRRNVRNVAAAMQDLRGAATQSGPAAPSGNGGSLWDLSLANAEGQGRNGRLGMGTDLGLGNADDLARSPPPPGVTNSSLGFLPQLPERGSPYRAPSAHQSTLLHSLAASRTASAGPGAGAGAGTGAAGLSSARMQQQSAAMQRAISSGAELFPIGASTPPANSSVAEIAMRNGAGLGIGSRAYSPGARALAHHAPGQSLPQGLAAGLSRLHLNAVGPSSSAAGNGAEGAGVGAAGLMSANALMGAGTSYEELAPPVPSSILPHRPSPLSLAARASGALGAEGGLSGTPPGSQGLSPSLNAGAGASPNLGPSSAGLGRMGRRFSASMRGVTPASPLAYPVIERDMDEADEAIFELE